MTNNNVQQNRNYWKMKTRLMVTHPTSSNVKLDSSLLSFRSCCWFSLAATVASAVVVPPQKFHLVIKLKIRKVVWTISS